MDLKFFLGKVRFVVFIVYDGFNFKMVFNSFWFLVYKYVFLVIEVNINLSVVVEGFCKCSWGFKLVDFKLGD